MQRTSVVLPEDTRARPRWIAGALLGALLAAPCMASAQEVVETTSTPEWPPIADYIDDTIAGPILVEMPTTPDVVGATRAVPGLIGHIDGVALKAGNAELLGWACQPQWHAPIDVHVYLAAPAGIGLAVGSYRSDKPSEPGVAGTCGITGNNYRFVIPLSESFRMAHGGALIYVHGISPIGAPNALLTKSGAWTVPPVIHDAAFVIQTAPPPKLLAGGTATVRVQMRNTGNTVWTHGTGYRLGSLSPIDNTTWGMHRVLLAGDVAPGGTATFDFTVKAPTTPGIHNFQWRMIREGVTWFGPATPNAAVTVEASTVTGRIESVDAAGVIHGWACSTHLAQSIDLHLYVGGGWPTGAYIGTYRADQASEPSIASQCGTQGVPHRFRIALSPETRQQHGGKTIDVHGISPLGTGNPLLDNAGVLKVPSMPTNATPSISVTRHYVYDAYKRLCKIVEPETGATVMGYDAANNETWRVSGVDLPSTTDCDRESVRYSDRRVDRTYDAHHRVRTLRFPDGRGDQDWTYTPDGLPATITTYNDGPGAGRVQNAYVYNARRQLTGETLHASGWTWSIGYGYNRSGHLVEQVNPDTSRITYAVNALGQTTGITGTSGTYVSNASYYPNGALKQFIYGNGIVHTLAQNVRGLPERSRDAYGGVAVLDDSYDFDAVGNVVAITDGATGRNQRGNRTMAYDGLDRLVSATSPMFGTATYAYDPLDNLTRVHVSGGSAARNHHYCFDANNRLTNVKTGGCGGASVIGLGYDVQGNMINKNGQQYAFDYGNRLREAVGKESYRYDAHGRRVSAASATGEIRSFYNQNGQLVFQADGRTGQQVVHAYLAGSLVATREQSTASGAAELKFHHTDALGTPVVVTDANRNVIERSEYEPYGTLLNRPLTNGVGYTGHVMDALTGNVYMQQRYMDPLLGVFTSVDPVTAYDVGDWRLFTRYAYGFNNPYRFMDPDGRTSKEQADHRREQAQQRREKHEQRTRERNSDMVLARGGQQSQQGQANGFQVSSVFAGDSTPTYTLAAAWGGGVKAELKPGQNNDRYSIVTPAVGGEASATWNLLTVSYDFGNSKATPIDIGAGIGGAVGGVLVIGGSLKYVPPTKVELNLRGGLGAAAGFEVFDIGITPRQLKE